MIAAQFPPFPARAPLCQGARGFAPLAAKQGSAGLWRRARSRLCSCTESGASPQCALLSGTKEAPGHAAISQASSSPSLCDAPLNTGSLEVLREEKEPTGPHLGTKSYRRDRNRSSLHQAEAPTLLSSQTYTFPTLTTKKMENPKKSSF